MTATAERVGRYELIRVIGRGGMATVYLARQTDLDRHVALKELAVLDRSGQRARRFLREARLAGSLAHPNIVTVHDYFEADGVPYIAMEHLARGSLRSHAGGLSPAQVGGVLLGMLAGLSHAEQQGVVHRDIKPENVLVTAQGSVKLADFGIAKAIHTAAETARLTTTGTTLGTPRYMAPERALGKDVGPWSDLYSVGVIAFELTLGRTPFHDTEEPAAVLMRQINDPVPAIATLRPDVDPAFSDWVARLLEKDLDRRTHSAAVAASELEAVLDGGLGAGWRRDAPLPEQPSRGRSQPTRATRAGVRPAAAAAAGAAELPAAASAPTMAPDTWLLDAPAAPRRGVRIRGRAALVLAAVALAVAGVAFAAGRDAGTEGGKLRTAPAAQPAAERAAANGGRGAVGDSRSDDPSDDEDENEEDENDNGD